ncbi:uncharacterized protein LOC128254628 isoform X2 [Drosophila gunungcola]|uniref:uncharacterized protein LOC128254628 isoform X2 n=1 Tax=Drosophila gunungcola TaxID=103775 RepID=UPI0022E15798|nr:uncharacterized protein LOC128254628 isoform X2 [Drosophila gunungcola]
MSRNRRRSLSSSETPSDGEQNGNDHTRLRSRSLPRQVLYANHSGTQETQMVDVAVGSSSTSLSQSQWTAGDPSPDPTKFSLQKVPHILVEATNEDKKRVTYTDATSTPIEPISEVPFVEPTYDKAHSPARDSKSLPTKVSSSESSDVPISLQQSSFADDPALQFASINEVISMQRSPSSTEQYDREEPLITKTQKFYKKRAPLVPRYDSDDSFAIEKEVIQQDAPSAVSAGYTLDDTESPGSFSEFDAERRRNSDLWDAESRSGTSKESFNLSRGRLGSGMVFIYMVIPPDGGFGWVIMVLAFLAQLIIDGLIFTVGILLPFIAKDLGVERTSVLFVASVQIGCYFTSGAFAAALINRFGFRKVGIAGVLCSSSAIMASSCSVNLTMLICFYSVLGGITMSMIWASSQLIVGYYFERYRPMANGFSCSGGGVGIVLFTFLNSWLVPIIGWRNMLRVQGGLVLLILLMVTFYVEVAPTQVGLYHRPNVLESSSDEYYGNFYVHDYLRLSNQTNGIPSFLSSYEPPPKKRRCASLFSCCTNCCEKRRKKAEPDEDHDLLIRPAPLEREDLFYTGPAEYEKPHSKEHLEGKEFHLMGSDKNTQQVNYGIKKIHVDEADTAATASHHRMQRWAKEPPKKPTAKKCRNSRFMVTLLKLFDYHLLKKFEFRVLVASALLYPMGFNIPFVYSSSRTKIPVEYARLIGPIIGSTNFLVRNICGLLAYKRKTWTTNICGCGLVFGGSSVFISAFYGQDLVWFQVLYGVCYGVAPAVFATLRGLIYVKYLGLPKLTNAFGITSLAMGAGAFIGTTIAGEMVGNSGNYTAAFSFAGLCLITAGMLKLLLPALVKFYYRKAH